MKPYFLLLFIFCSSLLIADGQLGEQLTEDSVARKCPNCGENAYSKLAMSCDKCNSSLEDIYKSESNKDFASLKIRLMYTGDKPNELPKYAKLYVNGKYIGNIEQTDIQARNSELSQQWNDGLGGIYTAIYEHNYSKVAPGLKHIVIEMRFPRLGGILKSNKKAKFEYMNFKAGKETKIDHYFNSAVTFTQHKSLKELNSTTNRSPIPDLPDAKIVTGNGTIGIDVGL